MKKHITIGTRGSLLATTQSTWIKNQIEKQYPDITIDMVTIITKGDKILDVPLAKVGGKGLFVKELEEALISKEVDLAVHSMKDVPSELPAQLHLGIIPPREDPRDAFIANDYASVTELPNGGKVGTSSLRRRAQLAALRADLVIEDLRGNLDTRLRKLDEKQYDAIILAAAGLNRLGLSQRATDFFSVTDMLPAVGQGALGLELRRDDTELLEGLQFLNHAETAIAVQAERAFLFRLEGGCQVPIGAYCQVEGAQLHLTGLIASIDGDTTIKESCSGSWEEAASLGKQLADELLGKGGREILSQFYEISAKQC